MKFLRSFIGAFVLFASLALAAAAFPVAAAAMSPSTVSTHNDSMLFDLLGAAGNHDSAGLGAVDVNFFDSLQHPSEHTFLAMACFTALSTPMTLDPGGGDGDGAPVPVPSGGDDGGGSEDGDSIGSISSYHLRC